MEEGSSWVWMSRLPDRRPRPDEDRAQAVTFPEPPPSRRLPEAPRPSRTSSRGTAATASGARRALVALALALLPGAAQEARGDARPLFEQDGRPLCEGRTGQRNLAAVVPDGAGGYLGISRDPYADPINGPDGGIDVALLRFGPDLRPLPVRDGLQGDDPCGALLIEGAGSQNPLVVFGEEDGRFSLLAFESHPDPGYDFDRLFLARYDREGAPLLPNVYAFASAPASYNVGGTAIPDGNGGWFAAWDQLTMPAGDGFAVVQHVGADGTLLWPEPHPLGLEPHLFGDSVALAADGAGGSYAVWSEMRLSLPRPVHRPYAQRLDASGAALWADGGVPLVPALPDFEVHNLSLPPASVTVPSGLLTLVSTGRDLRAQRVTPGGLRLDGDAGRVVIRLDDGFLGRAPRLVDLGDGTFDAVWLEDDRSSPTRTRVVTLRLGPDGAPLWPRPVPAIVTPRLQLEEMSVLALGRGALGIAFIDLGNDAWGAADIRAQVIDGRGRIKADPAGMLLCGAAGEQYGPQIFAPLSPVGLDPEAPPGSVQAQFVWSDQRLSSSLDIVTGAKYYVQSVTFTSRPVLSPLEEVPEARQGQGVDLVIDGQDLDPALVPQADPDLAAEVTRLVPDPSGPGDRLSIRVRVAPSAAVGRHTVGVVNPDGSASPRIAILDVALDETRIDLDGSGRVDGFDLALLASSFGSARGAPRYLPAADVDGSGLVDGVDLAYVAGRFGGAP